MNEMNELSEDSESEKIFEILSEKLPQVEDTLSNTINTLSCYNKKMKLVEFVWFIKGEFVIYFKLELHHKQLFERGNKKLLFKDDVDIKTQDKENVNDNFQKTEASKTKLTNKLHASNSRTYTIFKEKFKMLKLDWLNSCKVFKEKIFQKDQIIINSLLV